MTTKPFLMAGKDRLSILTAEYKDGAKCVDGEKSRDNNKAVSDSKNLDFACYCGQWSLEEEVRLIFFKRVFTS
jgi:hypothetical protein